jgi:hypothetical protein
VIGSRRTNCHVSTKKMSVHLNYIQSSLGQANSRDNKAAGLSPTDSSTLRSSGSSKPCSLLQVSRTRVRRASTRDSEGFSDAARACNTSARRCPLVQRRGHTPAGVRA